MDTRSKDLRLLLRGMAPIRSIPFIKSFMLPPDEESCLIDRECRGKSNLQISMEQHVSVDTVVRRRRSALRKIASAIEDQEDHNHA